VKGIDLASAMSDLALLIAKALVDMPSSLTSL